MFVDRNEEMNFLKKLYEKDNSQLLILYGRRRIGKTELLKQFSKNKKHLFFSSDLSSEPEQLRQFSEKLYQVTKESFLKTQIFSSWEALFRYIFDNLVDKIPIIIIDEFPYLCYSNKALPSIIQKIWDEKCKKGKLFLVLCGSYLSFMEKNVLGSKSPLFGRRTGQIFLKSLLFQDATEFFPKYSDEQKVMAYSILGGTPAYLQRFDDAKNIEQNVKEEILNKNSYLYSETRFLLMEELREPSIYFSIIKAVAFGRTRLNEIVQETKLNDSYKVNKYLTVLRELKIIKREVPITEEKPYKSRKGIYILTDHFFRFWFRYIFPNLSYLEEGEIDFVWSHKIKSDINAYIGFVFEDICIQRLKKMNRQAQLAFKAKKIGRWWDNQNEIDIVAYDEKNSFLFCECKWRRKKVGKSVLMDLQNKSKKFPQAKEKYFGFFSKSGFTSELTNISKEHKNIILF